MQITSIHNPLLQNVRKAAREGRPTGDGLVVAEGPHLLEEALRGTWHIAQVLTTSVGQSKYTGLLRRANTEVVEVSERAFDSLAGTQHSQGILALLRPRNWTWAELTRDPALIVVLDGIQDPGNAGTIVRSAEAFGGSGVVFLAGAAHVANGKLLRASAGSIFRLPFIEGITAPELLSNVRTSRLSLYALQAHAGTLLSAADLSRPLALIAGNEAKGVSPELLSAAEVISIPTVRVESINAAVACSIALFASQQQRSVS